MKALLTDQSGEDPRMEIGTVEIPEPADDELLIKIEATALNRADLMQKAGKYPPPEGESPLLGLEMAGRVEKCGKNVTGFKPGARVFGLLGGGGYAEYCTIDQHLAMKIPEGFSYEEAAAIPEVFLTAYQAVIWLGKLQENEKILIHAGASGVGTAAIQLACKLRNATVAVTAGSDEKLEICKSLGAELLINYKEQNYAEVVEKEFGKNSVNVVIDFVGSPYWEKNIRSMAIDGRIVYLAMLGGATIEKISLVPILRKRLTISGSTLRNRPLQYKRELTAAFKSDALHLFETKRLLPVIDSVYNWKDVEKAHQKMESNKNAGKIILNGM